MTRAAVLAKLSETDERVALRRADGWIIEGWILEVFEDAIVFDHAPSPFHAQATGTDEMSPPEERIALDAIAQYMDDARRWRPFPGSG